MRCDAREKPGNGVERVGELDGNWLLSDSLLGVASLEQDRAQVAVPWLEGNPPHRLDAVLKGPTDSARMIEVPKLILNNTIGFAVV